MDPVFERPSDRGAELAGKPGVVRFLDLAPIRAVMVDGEGSVGELAFAPVMPGLYGTAYGLRFALKRRGVPGRVGPLEGLYWTADGTTDLDLVMGADRGNWRWTLLIALPAEVTGDEVTTVMEAARAKMPSDAAPRLRIGVLDEGGVAQLLHLGPYGAERQSIDRLHAAIAAAGLQPRGAHHEIYLGDPRRSAPERLRTILRHPVEPVVPD
jgi:hypothetical protein